MYSWKFKRTVSVQMLRFIYSLSGPDFALQISPLFCKSNSLLASDSKVK